MSDAASRQPLTGEVPTMDVAELAAHIAAGGRVLDVRQPDEWYEVHVPGAGLVPLDQLGQRWEEIGTDGALAVICRSGARSLRAAEALRSVGIDAWNVTGGTNAWVASGREVVTGDQTSGAALS
jgi:rhodanese-related sulfurtransferase